jgi:hypothetical protein
LRKELLVVFCFVFWFWFLSFSYSSLFVLGSFSYPTTQPTNSNPLLISYSSTPFELHHFAAEPIVFAAKQRNSKPYFIHTVATSVACARLIAAHLCQRRQRFTPNAPSRGVDHMSGLLTQKQTPLVAQPSRCRTIAARDLPHVPLRGAVSGGTAIVPVEQDGI